MHTSYYHFLQRILIQVRTIARYTLHRAYERTESDGWVITELLPPTLAWSVSDDVTDINTVTLISLRNT